MKPDKTILHSPFSLYYHHITIPNFKVHTYTSVQYEPTSPIITVGWCPRIQWFTYTSRQFCTKEPNCGRDQSICYI